MTDNRWATDDGPPLVTDARPIPTGVVVGLRSEARCLAGFSFDIAIGGARTGRAELLTRELVARGVERLLSFGMAGGLDPDLAPGTLIVADAVIAPDKTVYRTDSAWSANWAKAAGRARLEMRRGAIAGTDRILAAPDDKRALGRATGALAVDMESHEVARVAGGAKIAFAVVRAIADPAHRALAQAALSAVREDGDTNVTAVARSLLRRPWEIYALLRLGADASRALASLRGVAVGFLGGMG